MNRLRHGLTSATIVLPTEDPAQFSELLDDYVQVWKPANPFELDLVHELTVCRWRLMRILNAESRAIEVTIERKREQVDKELHNCPNSYRTAFGIMSLAEESKSLALIMRYERNLTRRFDQLVKQLKSLQNERLANEAESPSEPQKKNCETNSPGPVLVPKPAIDRRPLSGTEPQNPQAPPTTPVDEDQKRTS